MPDFKKLKTHPNYAMISNMAKPMNIDLDELAKMELDEQVRILLSDQHGNNTVMIALCIHCLE